MYSRILRSSAITVGVCVVLVLPAPADQCDPARLTPDRPLSFGLPGDNGCPDPDNGGPDPDPDPNPDPLPAPDLEGPCDARITALDTQGKAPFTVHVHALNLADPAECLLDAVYSWDFGDPGSEYNRLDGWNAAHSYDEPGNYTITLTVVDAIVGTMTETIDVTITTDNRDEIYVSASGNDANSGGTPGQAVRTVGRVQELIGHSTKVHFRRGDTFSVPDVWTLRDDNVLLTSYGSGSLPKLRWSGAQDTVDAIIDLDGSIQNTVIEELRFETPYAPDRDIARGIRPNGVNTTVRYCEFANVSDAINNELVVNGFLSLKNTAEATGTYFCWNSGYDVVHLGDTVAPSVNEHNIRSGDIQRILIWDCDLYNEEKSCIWLQRGQYAWIARNSCLDGSVNVGPNAAFDHDPFFFARMESNDVDGAFLTTFAGAHYVRMFDNLILDHSPAIIISGYLPQWNRTSSYITMDNNTAVFDDESGRFANIGSDVENLAVIRNIFYAPNLETGGFQSSNIYVEQYGNSLLPDAIFHENVWTDPERLWCDGVFYVWSYWFECEGYMNENEWDALPNTSMERVRQWDDDDLDEFYQPTFQTDAGAYRPLLDP